MPSSSSFTKGSFYNHFESKEALALVVMDRYGETRHLDKLTDTSTPPLLRLRAHFAALAQDIEDFAYERGCVYGNFSTEAADHIPAIRAGVAAAFDQWAKAITAAIREAQTDGSLTTTQDAGTLGRFLINAWEGAIVGERAAKDGSSFAAFFTVIFETVLH